MKPKIILYIAITLDGYIASQDYSVAWLHKYNNIKGQDYGYKKFFDSIDTVIVGNTTQKQFPQKYRGKPTFIFSKKEKENYKNLTYVNENPKDFMKKYAPKGNIWLLGGADIISQFMDEGLVDEYIIMVMPEFLGKGIPLFKGANKKNGLKLIGAKTHGEVVELHYKNK